MKPLSLLRRVLARLYRELAVRAGFDPLTGTPIRRRADLKRYGNRGAEWTIPTALLSSDSVVYCVGCGEDISFDLALIAEFGCEVHGFDPTPRAIQHVERVAKDQPRYVFHAVGLWSERKLMRFFAPVDPRHVSHSLLNVQKTESFFEAQVERLAEIQRELGHTRVGLLKLDIEGAEYEVLRTLEEDSIFPQILCVEFDEFFHPLDAAFKTRIRDRVQRILSRGYELVHTSGNANYTFARTLNE